MQPHAAGWKNPTETGQTGERLRRKLKAKKVQASCRTQQKGSLRTVQGPQADQAHPPVQDRQAYQISPAYQASTAEQAAHHLKVPDHPMKMPHQAAQVHPEVPMFMTVMEERHICNGCGADITGSESAHIKENILNGCGGWHNAYVTVQEAYDEQVLVSEGWDETVITGYKCSVCGVYK